MSKRSQLQLGNELNMPNFSSITCLKGWKSRVWLLREWPLQLNNFESEIEGELDGFISS